MTMKIKDIPRELRKKKIKKEILVSLILVSSLLLLFPESVSGIAPQTQNQAQNATWVLMGERVTLQAQGMMPYNPSQNFSLLPTWTNAAGIAWNETNYFIVDYGTDNLTIWDKQWNLLGNCDISSAGFTDPSGVTTRVSSDKVWIVNRTRVGVFKHDCTLVTTYTMPSMGRAEGITTNDANSFWVVDDFYNYLRKYNSTFALKSSCDLYAVGIPTPRGVAVSNDGQTIYVLDQGNNQIYAVNTTCGILYNFTVDPPAGSGEGLGIDPPDRLVLVDYVDDMVYNFSITALDSAVLAVNISDSWENISTTGMNGVSIPTTASFHFSNSTVCDKNVGWRIYFNDSLGNWGSTSIMTFHQVPYLYSGSGTLACKNKNNATLTQTTSQTIRLYMGYFQRNATFKECSYTCNNCNEMNLTNSSTYCIIDAETKDVSSVRFDEGIFVKAFPPSNLPAVLAGSLAVIIIVVYTYTTKRKAKGW